MSTAGVVIFLPISAVSSDKKNRAGGQPKVLTLTYIRPHINIPKGVIPRYAG